MITTTVCKVIDFPAAHANAHHGGGCSRVHGHTWSLEIHCRGQVRMDHESPAFGMVVDFAEIKLAYEAYVEPKVEHAFLNETLDLPEYTTELIAQWIWNTLKPHLPLHKIRLWEGKTSFAEIEEGHVKIVNKDLLPAHGEFKDYVKIGTTRIAGPYPPPVKVDTVTGPHYVTNQECYIGMDSEGFPYPIEASVMDASYRGEAAPDGG